MAAALEQFVKQLADSGVIAPGKLEQFVPPKAHPKDAQELARQLVQSNHLTKFQAQEIYQGRAKSLILGNYTILDKIGAGGMGQVFKAEHRRMKRIVAVKMLPKAVTKNAAAVARFQREVEAAAKLRHPNIVAADDADEAGGVHFLVMEYVEGSDLSALVKKHGPLSVAKAVNYVLQAARGLEFAHGEGIVHRDIKPANLLLDKKGTVKILDMGLARIEGSGDAKVQAELTGTGAVMGTVDYMAPEQALSSKHADARADIYSLGCSLFYLITGKAIYDGDTLMAKLLAHREKPVPSLGADVPEHVQAVFEKMVAKTVEDRYQTMGEVVTALEQCSSGQHTSVSIQQSVGTDAAADLLTFLRDIPLHPIKKAAAAKTGRGNRKFILGAVGAGVLGIAILAGMIVKVQTRNGTLVVEVDQPDAMVQVMNEDGKVEIARPGEKGTLSIAVDPGKHRLKVEKDGFQFFAQDFTMESGGKQSITAKLVPLKAAVATGQPNKPWNTPAFQQWMKTVAALPAEKQVDAVAKKLMELNPGFDGEIWDNEYKGPPKIESGIVTEIGFHANHVTDISPVRALVGLNAFKCVGSIAGKGKLADLSPLQGMKLTTLSCFYTQVSDLSPLQGMKLSHLFCGGTKVSDLSPLVGMPLKTLYFESTPVSDLSPLEGMELTDIRFTPKNITKGLDTIRQMKNLKTIQVKAREPLPPTAFWKKYDAGEFGRRQ
jgi:tRNA A-37 threonylcarbamoyl transferase component Bud32